MKKNKKVKLLFLLFIIAFIFLASNNALALEIKKYPSLPGVSAPNPNCKGSDCLGEFVAYILGLLIYLAGAVSAISFAIGAVSFIASGDSPEINSSARDRMKGAVLGLVLTMVSVVIIRTINPKLAEPSLTPLGNLPGFFYSNGIPAERKSAPGENPDASTRPAGYNEFEYTCPEGGGPVVLVWQFNNENYTPVETAKVSRLTCADKLGIQGKSFKMTYEFPGVYYCLEGCNGVMCKGNMSYANTYSQDEISEPFRNNIKGVRIVNDPGNDIYYGVIFHKVPDLNSGGECSFPKIHTGFDNCLPINSMQAAAADIFKINKKLDASGDGVTFYSKTFGWASGQEPGYFEAKDENIIKSITSSEPYSIQPKDMSFTWVAGKDKEKTLCPNFQTCPGSMQIKGRYLVGLYSNTIYCQTFTESVSELNAQPITARGASLTNTYIIPLK